MSPTEQARGDSGKEPKLPLRQNGEKKPWEKPGSVGGAVLSGQDIIVYLLLLIVLIKILNVFYFYFYIVAISNNNSIM